MALTSTHIICAAKNRQLLKIKFHPEKLDEMGKISFLTQPCQQGQITAIACSLKMLYVFTASTDKSVAKWEYSAENKLKMSFRQNMNDEILAMDIHP